MEINPNTAARLTAVRSREGDAVVITAVGELDLSTIPILEAELRQAERDADHVVLDLEQLSFIDSSGLRALIHAQKRADADHFVLSLRRVSRQAQKLFEVTGALNLFQISE
jgi:anti-anti-sigma factor